MPAPAAHSGPGSSSGEPRPVLSGPASSQGTPKDLAPTSLPAVRTDPEDSDPRRPASTVGASGRKFAVIGSRDFSRLGAVAAFVRLLHEDDVVISGGAAGVDSMAVETAKARGLAFKEILPDYRKHHPKLAPKIRNREIAQACDSMVAFWDGNSGGTANACMWALYYGKDVTVFLPAEEAARLEVSQSSEGSALKEENR